MKFNMSKCHTLPLTGRKKLPERNCTLDGKSFLSNVETEKDLRLIVDMKLSFREHCEQYGSNNKEKRSEPEMKQCDDLAQGISRPHLEYANQAWTSYLTEDKVLFENVQRRATSSRSHMKI